MNDLKKAKLARLTWDEMFMNLAVIAAKRTACKFHETGAVFADKNHRIVSIGYNGPTAGDLHCNEVGCAKVDGDPVTGKLRRCRGAHAEVNGIINCSDTKRLKGATLYSVLFPCFDCMKAMNNVGISEIVYLNEYKRIQTGGEAFEEEDESLELARKRNILIRRYDGRIYCGFPDEYNTAQQIGSDCCAGNCKS